MASISGVRRTARNPVNPPSEGDYPCVNIFELDDMVTSPRSRGASKAPAYKRELSVVVEPFVMGDSEPQATQKLGLFVIELKKKLYEGGITLGLSGVEVTEESMSQIYRPSNTEKIAGVGITLKISYVEDISRLGV
jgi:hypothetical protein